MGLRIFQVDAFADVVFRGNPAGVCLLPDWPDAQWMQSIAREMNLAETAFLVAAGEDYALRWFTPAVEVDLCGHATLASAHILWQQGLLERQAPARFHTRSGLLTAVRREAWIEMDFPAAPAAAVEAPPGLAPALGFAPVYVGRNRFDYLIEAESEQQLRAARPDLAALSRLPARGFILTSRSADPRYDFVSRFFAPAVGVPEDPVTGSAHCCLGPFWGARLQRAELTGYQASARGGLVRVRVAGERVLLGGRAVTVFDAELAPAALPA